MIHTAKYQRLCDTSPTPDNGHPTADPSPRYGIVNATRAGYKTSDARITAACLAASPNKSPWSLLDLLGLRIFDALMP
jgi:hypothetical protein